MSVHTFRAPDGRRFRLDTNRPNLLFEHDLVVPQALGFDFYRDDTNAVSGHPEFGRRR